MATFAEKIAQLTNPTPTFKDPEDDADDVTKATLHKTELSHDDDDSGHMTSSLRIRSAQTLDDGDLRYSGKKTSRKKLQKMEDSLHELESETEDDGEESDNESDEADDSMMEESPEGSDDLDLREFQSKFSKSKPLLSAARDSDDSSEELVEADSQSEESDEDDMEESEGSGSGTESEDEDEGDAMDISTWMDQLKEEGAEPEQKESEEGIQSFSKTNISDEIQKGKAVRDQIGLWDSLLEGRIKLQGCLSKVNRLPQTEYSKACMQQGGEAYRKAVTQSQASLKKLLDVLVQLQSVLMMKNPETKYVIDSENSKSPAKKEEKPDNNDDEEITSESEAEDKTSQSETSVDLTKKKIKMANYPEFLAKRHKLLRSFRNETIQKWYDKTRISSGKMSSKSFSAFDQSAIKQIEQILSDRDRLVKRTQLRRSSYKVIGQVDKPKVEPTEQDEDAESVPDRRDHLNDYDLEIFDDDDFYHQLLRELIERKSSDLNDPVAITKQWLEIQKLRSKKVKNVDRKASKGRKIRYDVHPKLVNFMAPVDTVTWTDEQRDDLYSSLFGQRHETPTDQT